MIRKTLILATAAVFMVCGAASLSSASDAGPEEMTLVTTGSSKPKPAFFPHKKHQETIACADCHHGMVDGKQVPYQEGMEIKKCESCHNPEVLGGKMAGKEKLDTFKGAAHANCLGCHKEVAAKDESKKALKSCKTCHQS